MGVQYATALFALLVVCGLVAAQVDTCPDGSCQASPVPRSGSAMFQTKAQNKPAAGPHREHHKTHHEHKKTRGPEDVMLSYSNRVAAVTERVTQLETKSGDGRAELRTGLDALKESTNTVSADMDAGKARLASAEGSLASLEGVVTDNGATLRTALDNLKNEFDALGQRVGQQYSAMMQSWEQREDPAPPAPAAPSGDALTSQVTGLEGRCASLEEESGSGRLALKNELDAVEKQIVDIQSGGAQSLDNTIDRISSAEHQMASLSSSADDQGADLSAGLANVKKQLDGLNKKLGNQLIQRKSSPTHMKKVTHADPQLPLSSRIASLETRVGLLEKISEDGRGDLQLQLDRLSTTLANTKEGGVRSLAHTVLRVGSIETEIGSLTASVEMQKTDITAETANLQAMLDGLSATVGA